VIAEAEAQPLVELRGQLACPGAAGGAFGRER
jgi:hypothetical protein